MNCYWWRGIGNQTNFGDELCAPLLSHFAGISTTWFEPEYAEIITIGSILDVLPQSGWTGIVAGVGKLLAETHTDLTQADVRGLRGPLTLADVKLKRHDRRNVVLGDPALIVPDMVPVVPDTHPLGCVPHISDSELYPREVARARRDHYVEPILIDPTGPALEVVAKIGSCRKIISSSLHGIVVADAFGIPRRAERFAEMDTNRHQGQDWKFRDYSASINMPIEFGKLQTPSHNRIERMQYDLLDMLTSLRDH